MSLLVPSLYHGLWADVRGRCRRAVTRLRQGQTLEEAAGAEFLDTAAVPGLLLLHGPSPLVAGAPQFHCFALHSVVRDAYLERRLSPEVESDVFRRSLEHPWAFLGLVSEPSLGFLNPPERHLPLVDAAARFLDALLAVGERYSDGRDWGMAFWEAQSGISYALVNLGVPRELVNSWRPEQGFDRLLARIRDPG